MIDDEDVDEPFDPTETREWSKYWRGRPNLRKDGTLRYVSKCHCCVHYQIGGYITDTQSFFYSCVGVDYNTTREREFPNVKNCPYYMREPGADDE